LDEKYFEFYPAEDYITIEEKIVTGYGVFSNIKTDTSFLLDLKK
jgi:hypothetical protein